MNTLKFIPLVIATLLVTCTAFAQQPQPQPPQQSADSSKTRFFDKIGHWVTAYTMSAPEYLEEERRAFKARAFAEVYVNAIIDKDVWLFKMLNRVTEARYPERQTPYVLFTVKLKPNEPMTAYTVTMVLSSNRNLGTSLATIVNNAAAAHLTGKTYKDPMEAAPDIEKALLRALGEVATAVGKDLAPKLLLRYNDEVFWNGHQIDILDAEGNFVELEAIDSDLKPIPPAQLTWTNADAFENKGVVDMTNTAEKQVQLQRRVGSETHSLSVTLRRVNVSQDINQILKALIIEALSAKKQQARDSIARFKADSVTNANDIARYLASIEAENFPMEGEGVFSPMSEAPTMRPDSTLVFANPQVGPSLKALKARKKLGSKIRRKLNVVALADLIVDHPEKVSILLDELLRNSGRLIGRLILSTDSNGERAQLRDIVLDFLNKNLERIAGGQYPASLSQEPPLAAAPKPAQRATFDPQKHLYVNPRMTFPGKDEVIQRLTANIDADTYVFINYSQDVSMGSFQARVKGTRPAGLPAGAKYKVFTVLHVPGSLAQWETAGTDEGQVFYTEETKEQEVARFINFIKCAKSKSTPALKVHYGSTSYRVKVGAMVSLLNFAGTDLMASAELNNAELSVNIGQGAFSQDDIIIGYDDIVLNVSAGQYTSLQKLQIPAVGAGGIVFRFPSVTDQTLKQSLFNWLLRETGFNGTTVILPAVNNSMPVTAQQVLLYSECQLSQLTRTNRETLINELLSKQHNVLGLDRDTYQYLLLYVLESIPDADQAYFYTFFNRSPAKIRTLYYQMSGQNTPRLISVWLRLWEKNYKSNASTASAGKLVLSKNVFGNATNGALLEESGSVLFLQPYRHGNQTDTHFRVNHPFDPIYIYRPELGDEKPFVTLPAVAAVYFLDEEHVKTWQDMGLAGLQLGLFAVGVGEVVTGLRAASVALQGSGLLSRQFLLAGVKTAVGTADVVATAVSSYCDGETNDFCIAWQKYEFYINIGLLTASVADGVFNKLSTEYPRIRNDLSESDRRVLDEVLAKGGDDIIELTVNGRTIGKFSRGKSLEIIDDLTLHGGNNIKLSPNKTTTVTGTLDDVNLVAERGVNADKTFNGITAANVENVGGINILRSPKWGQIKNKYKSVNATGQTVYDWNKIADEFWETVNKPWLDDAITRGDNLRLVSNPANPKAIHVTDDVGNFVLDANGNKIKSIFGREVDYLKSKGYTILSDGTAIK